MLSDALVVFDHLKHTVTIIANADLEAEPDIERAYEQAARTIGEVRCVLAGPVPRAEPMTGPSHRTSDSSGPRADADFRVEHAARALRSDGLADRRVHPRRRRLPGRALAALVGAGAGRGVLDLPRPAGGQPEPVHVLPGLRRLPGRGREPRAAADGERPPGEHQADRGHPSRAAPARGGPADRTGAAGRREGARRARDARRPRAQRPRPRVRVRQRPGGRADGDRVLQPRDAHRLLGVGDAASGRRGDGRAALGAAGGDALGRAEGARDADHRRARAGQARRLRRRDRLPQLRGRPRHGDPHPHGRRQGRRRPCAGRRRHRRRRQARVRVRGVGREDQGGAARRRAACEQPDWS